MFKCNVNLEGKIKKKKNMHFSNYFNGSFLGTVFLDLSKAYDCIPHELLIAKWKCYGIEEKENLRLLLDYLANQKKRTKLVHLLVHGVILIQVYHKDQSLVLFFLTFFINDLLFYITKSEVCNFTDSETPCSCNKNLGHVFSILKYEVKNVLGWIKINSED